MTLTDPSGLRAMAVILVRPQMGENIGAAARAMRNFGLTRLRLVAPRDGWPSEPARAMAAGADDVIDATEVFDTFERAVSDLNYLYAATARGRGMPLPVLGPAEAADQAAARIAGGTAVGLVFGAERTGLTNDEVAACDAIVTFPADPTFASLNLAQAVLLQAYEMRRALCGETPVEPLDPPAPEADFEGLMAHLEDELDARNYWRTADKKPVMMRNLRAMLARAEYSVQEVRTLRGVVKALTQFQRR